MRLFAVLLLFVAACSHRSASDTEIADLLRVYRSDPAAADKIYKGRDFTVTGTVNSLYVATHQFPRTYVYFDVSRADGKGPPFQIECAFAADKAVGVTSLIPGQPARIRGTCRGVVGDNLLFVDCEVLRR